MVMMIKKECHKKKKLLLKHSKLRPLFPKFSRSMSTMCSGLLEHYVEQIDISISLIEYIARQPSEKPVKGVLSNSL